MDLAARKIRSCITCMIDGRAVRAEAARWAAGGCMEPVNTVRRGQARNGIGLVRRPG
jgi:hypothetical protein